MRNQLTLIAAAAAAVLALGACTESPQDAAAENTADALEAQAAATSNEAEETALNNAADTIEQQAGNADGGATTANTPSTAAADNATR